MSTPDHNEHAGRVSGMFGRIAGWYDFLNHFLSLGLDIVWRRRLVRAVRPGPTGRFLDLAAGTMDVTLELRRQHPTALVLAMDFALPMLQKGKTKLAHNRFAVQPVLADGRAIPLPEGSVDAVTIAFGIRNILPRQEAYAEILRVLAPDGRLCILEFGSSRRPIWKGLYNFYLNRLLPLVGRVISGDGEAYSYLADTIGAFPTADELVGELQAAGFVNVAHEPLMSGIVNIHVAEKPRSTGDTYFIGATQPPRAKATETTPAQAALPPHGPAPVSEPPASAEHASTNVTAGLRAMDQAVKAKAAPKKKAPAKAKPSAQTPQKKTTAAKTAKKTPAKKATTTPKATGKATPKAKAASGKKAESKKKAAPKTSGAAKKKG